MEIRFTFSDDLLPAIQRALAAAHDFTPAMAAISATMATGVDDRFQGEHGPDGTPWKPSQRVIESGGKTLQIRGMRGGLLGNLLGNAGYDSISAWIGTNLRYAAIHQLGGQIRAKPVSKGGKGYLWIKGKTRADGSRLTVGSVTMPVRPFLGFGETEQREIPEILADHLRSAFAGGAA